MKSLRMRFTIGQLMSLVAVLAIGLAMHRLLPEILSVLVISLTLAALGAAVLGARFQRERGRAFCVGFALAGGAFFSWFVSPTLATGAAESNRRIARSLITLPVAAAGGSAASLRYGQFSRWMTGRWRHSVDEGVQGRGRPISPPE
jgi:hypothetical protein